MVRGPIVFLLGVVVLTWSMGGDGYAANKKKSSAQIDGAILVVGAVDGPMPAPPRGPSSSRVGSGILKSIDGGRTWRRRPSRPDRAYWIVPRR
jgi:hypothetical protein